MDRFDGIEAMRHHAGGRGHERRAFTAAELFRMQGLGTIDKAEGFELIVGDTVMMPSRTHRASASSWP